MHSRKQSAQSENEILRKAIKIGDLDTLEAKLSGPIGRILSKNTYYALNWQHYATLYGSKNVLVWLFDKKKLKVNQTVGAKKRERTHTLPTDKGKVLVTGDTCLHIAAREGHEEIVRYLVKRKGVNVMIRNERGLTADQVKDHRGRQTNEIIRLLIQNQIFRRTPRDLPTPDEYKKLLEFQNKFEKMLPRLKEKSVGGKKRRSTKGSGGADTVVGSGDDGSRFVNSLRILFRPKPCLDDLAKAGRTGRCMERFESLKRVLDSSSTILESEAYKNLLEIFGLQESSPKFNEEEIEKSRDRLNRLMEVEDVRIQNTEVAKTTYQKFLVLFKVTLEEYFDSEEKRDQMQKKNKREKFNRFLTSSKRALKQQQQQQQQQEDSDSSDFSDDEADSEEEEEDDELEKVFLSYFQKKRELESLKEHLLRKCAPSFLGKYLEIMKGVNNALKNLNQLTAPKVQNNMTSPSRKISRRKSSKNKLSKKIVEFEKSEWFLDEDEEEEDEDEEGEGEEGGVRVRRKKRKVLVLHRSLSDYSRIFEGDSDDDEEEEEEEYNPKKKCFTAFLKGDKRVKINKDEKIECIAFLYDQVEISRKKRKKKKKKKKEEGTEEKQQEEIPKEGEEEKKKKRPFFGDDKIEKFMEENRDRIQCMFEMVMENQKHICFEMIEKKPKIKKVIVSDDEDDEEEF